MKNFVFPCFVLLAVILGCSKKESIDTDNSSHLYKNFLYSNDEILIKYADYGTKPNFKNILDTSELTKDKEATSSNLTLKMDVYIPPNTGSNKIQPPLIMIHGGFHKGDKTERENAAISYARAGYVYATINYRLTKIEGDTSLRSNLYA